MVVQRLLIEYNHCQETPYIKPILYKLSPQRTVWYCVHVAKPILFSDIQAWAGCGNAIVANSKVTQMITIRVRRKTKYFFRVKILFMLNLLTGYRLFIIALKTKILQIKLLLLMKNPFAPLRELFCLFSIVKLYNKKDKCQIFALTFPNPVSLN